MVGARRLRFLLLAPLVPALLAGGGQPVKQRAPRGAPLTIGMVVDDHGVGSTYGIPIRKGAKLAASLINASGGLDGRGFRLRFINANSDVTRVTSAFRTLIKTPQVLGILGPTLSSEAVVADPIAQRAHIPVIATSNTAPGIPQIGPYIFRLSIGDAQVIPLVVRTAMARLHFKRAAIIYDNVNAFSIGNFQIFSSLIEPLGLDLVDTETFVTGATDYTAQLTKIRDAHPDIIFVGALATDAAPLTIGARRLGIPSSVHFIGGNGFNTPLLIKLGGSAADGAISGTAWYANSPRVYTRRFIALYRQRFGLPPDQYAAQSFDGVNIMAAALRAAGPHATRAGLRKALASVGHVRSVTGATGFFHFTPDRDAGVKPIVQMISGGRFQIFR